MITFGSFNAGAPIDPAMPPSGAEAAGDAGNGFDNVLGQMMGEGMSLDADAAGAEEFERNEDGGSKAADLTELVNPLAIDLLPMTLAGAPTPVKTVWNEVEESVDTALAAFTDMKNALAEIEKAWDASAAIAARTIKPTDATAEDFTVPVDAKAAEAAAVESVPPVVPAADGGAPEAIDPAAAAKNELASAINESMSKPEAGTKNDRAARKEKHQERSRFDARPEAIAAPAPTATAVARAYASGDQDASRSFDRSRDGEPPLRLQAIGQPVSSPSFVVPVDARSMLAAPAPAMTLDAAVPANLEAAIEAHVPQQIVHSVRIQAINGGGEAVVRLNPDYLGEVVVAVKVENGSVIADLQAETPAVRQWVERNEAVLRQALADQGLQLERLTITETPEAESEQRDADDRQQQSGEEQSRQQSRRRRPKADDATFEVTV